MKHVLLIESPDEKGLVFKVAHQLFNLGLNIDLNDEFVDQDKQKFFMRTEFSGDFQKADLKEELASILPAGAKIKLEKQRVKDIVVMVTKESHCIGDILLRCQAGSIPARVKAVICNHSDLASLVGRFDIPFYEISNEGLSREEHEEKVLAKLAELDFDYLVLAKYMRILNASFTNHFPGRIINIHHSFLPAFIGANPYKQAYERGVKIIGATAHFVTEDLDEGPIIAQDVVNIDHSLNWKEMREMGRDVEQLVLAKALKLVFNDRVFINGNKTIIL